MNWTDEHYVKLYTRETPGWAMLPWQSRLLLPALLKKCDHAGLIDLGKEHERALGAFLGVPLDFVKEALPGLLESGTCELRNGVLIVPKFQEAQEARKTKIAAAREYRARVRDDARAAKLLNLLDSTVAARSGASDRVILQPDVGSAQPDQHLHEPAKQPPVVRVRKPADPRVHPLQLKLEADFAELRSEKYAHQGAKDTQALKALLPIATDEQISARWRRALSLPASEWRSCSTFAQLKHKWPDLSAPGSAPLSAPPRKPGENIRLIGKSLADVNREEAAARAAAKPGETA